MGRMTNDEQFPQLLAACGELSAMFPDGIAFIGGIAVYLHAINNPATHDFAEATHDGDFYISMADMGELRDIEELTPNRRLSKHQLIKAGFEFDIYTERHSALIVPYSEVISRAENYGDLKVAGLEHLFALKVEAYRDRRSSSKGSKDAKDLIRIVSICAARKKPLTAALIAPYLRDEHLALLEDLIKRPEFVAMARGNAMQAKKLRNQFAAAVAALKKAS
jgi:hypothetical protein